MFITMKTVVDPNPSSELLIRFGRKIWIERLNGRGIWVVGLHHLFSKRFFTVRLQQVDLNGNPRKGILNMFHFLQRLLLLPILSACAHSHTHFFWLNILCSYCYVSKHRETFFPDMVTIYRVVCIGLSFLGPATGSFGSPGTSLYLGGFRHSEETYPKQK